ncbi:MAG: STT3 domain-containing protein [archaeon]
MTEHEHTHHETHTTHHSDPHIGHQKNLVQKITQTIWDNRAIIVLLIAIFLLALGIRGHLLRYHYLFEFDAFYHARLVESLVTTGSIPAIDHSVYYQLGGMTHQPASVYHYVSAAFYELISFGQPYSKDLLMYSMQLNPVIFGSLICILMYFLTKEIFNNRKISLITAFVAAVTPAFAYRTMAGAQGDNAFGFLWMVIGFIFFVRSIKNNGLNKATLINALIAGIFFGLMAMTWRMYLLIPLIVILYAIFAIIWIASKEESGVKDFKSTKAFAFAVKVLLAMVVFHVISYAYGEDWISDALGYVSGPLHVNVSIIAIGVIVGSIIAIALSIFVIPKLTKETKNLFSILVIAGLYLGFLAMVMFFITVPDLHDRTSIGAMVGEESNGNQFFGTKYNDLIIFPWLAIVLLPIGLYLFRNKEDFHTAIIYFFWVIITLFLAWYTLKFTFVFGLAIAPAAAIVCYIALEGLKKFEINKGIETKVILGALLLIVLLGVGASARFFPDYVPYNDEHPEWVSAENWIIQNTAIDAKFFNWWDQGHILAFLTDRMFTTDNRNSSMEANVAMAKFVTLTDTNAAYGIAKDEMKADYIILDSDMVYSAPTFEYYVAGKVDSKVTQKYVGGTTRVLSCTVPEDVNASVSCEGSQLPRAQWNSLATKWKSNPDDFQNGSDPVFYYRTSDQLIILNQAMNNTNLMKAWLNSDETSKYYEEAYYKSGVKILKIKK